MLRFSLRAVRWLLKKTDILITRQRFGNPYFAPPEDGPEIERWRAFLSRLDAPGKGGEAYRDLHLDRLARTLSLVPAPGATGRALELGCYMQITPALALALGYREVRGAYLGPAGQTDSKAATMGGQEVFRCEIDLFDAERDPFPYQDGAFDCVLACEILEHLRTDPMHMLTEIRRVLAEGGALVLTTPNCASLNSVTRALHGYENPQVFACYPHPERSPGEVPHVREYTPSEARRALEAAGFRVEMLETDRIGGYREGTWTLDLLERHGFDTTLRGEQIYCRAIKDSALPVTRYPAFLYK